MSKRKRGLASGPVNVASHLREAMIERCQTQPDAELLIEMLGLNGEIDETQTSLEDLAKEVEQEDLPA